MADEIRKQALENLETLLDRVEEEIRSFGKVIDPWEELTGDTLDRYLDLLEMQDKLDRAISMLK